MLLPLRQRVRASNRSSAAGKFSATDVFRDQNILRSRKAAAAAAIAAAGTDVLVVPTVMHHYLVRELTEQEAAAPPVATYNAYLGTFTNFVNLLGMCALSVPAGMLPPMPQEVRARRLPSLEARCCSRRAVVQCSGFLHYGSDIMGQQCACMWHECATSRHDFAEVCLA